MKTTIKSVLAPALALALLAAGAMMAQDKESEGAQNAGSTPAITAATMPREHDPIQVPGDMLESMLGKDFASLRLFACKNGKMEQIVYQFDERLPDGTFIMDLGEKANADKHNNKLDPQDYLIFRLGDTGDRMAKEGWPAPEGLEIELKDPITGGLSYCYLILFEGAAPPELDIDTVVLEHWDPWKSPELPFIVSGKSYRIEGLVNRFGDKYYKTAINKSFIVPKDAGGSGEDILDCQKMRAYMELFFGKIRVDKTEYSMIGGIDSLRHGKVRGYGRQWLTVKLPLDIESSRIYSDVFTYDRVIVSPMQLNIPINPDAIITRAGIEFGYDFNEKGIGMRFYSPNCMDGVTIDGKMTDKEKAIPEDWVPWYLVTGPQGSLIFRVKIEKALMEQSVNKLTYIDDLEQKLEPEDVPGSIGYARTNIEVTSVKPGKYDFQIEWYFPPNFYKQDGYDKQMLKDFLDIKDAPIVISIGGKTAKNMSLSPEKLIPNK